MENEKIKAYTTRISQANRSELVVIIYELILDSVDLAVEYYNAEKTEKAEKEMKRAQGFLNELKGSLDGQFTLSGKLRGLYRYVNEQYIATILRRKPVNLESCQNVIRGLLESFEEVARQDESGPVMENTQQIYAGLTYGKDSLNEVFLQGDENSRGFRA